MRPARAILTGLLTIVIFGIVLLNAAMAQDIPQQSITFGDFKITLGLKKDDLFRRMESRYWLSNGTPTTGVRLRKGWRLIWSTSRRTFRWTVCCHKHVATFQRRTVGSDDLIGSICLELKIAAAPE